jgi:hypothetical protein
MLCYLTSLTDTLVVSLDICMESCINAFCTLYPSKPYNLGISIIYYYREIGMVFINITHILLLLLLLLLLLCLTADQSTLVWLNF